MRFLVDENLPLEVPALLEQRGHDVLYLAHSDARGATDEEVWERAIAEERIIVTRDLDFPLPRSPQPPGIILIRVPDTYSRRQIETVVAEFVASETFAQVTGAITVVEPFRIRTRKL